MKSIVLLIALASYVQNSICCSCFPMHPQTEFCNAGYAIRFDVLDRSFVLRDYNYNTGKSYVTRILSDDLFKKEFRARRSVISEESERISDSITHVEIPSPPEIPSLHEIPPIPDIPVINEAPPIPPIFTFPEETEIPEIPSPPKEPLLPEDLEWDPEEIPPPVEFTTMPELPAIPTTEDPYLWFRAEAMYTLGNIRIYKGEDLVESLMGPGKTIKGFSALDGARCGVVLSVGETYYYMGSSMPYSEIEFSACSFLMSKSQDLKSMHILSNLKKNLVYNWPKACNSSCHIKTNCYYYCPEIEDVNKSLVCDEDDLHAAKKDAWNMESACMRFGDVCQWSVGDEILPVPTKLPKLDPNEKMPPSNDIFLLTPPNEDRSINVLPIEPQIAILEMDSKTIKSMSPLGDQDENNSVPTLLSGPPPILMNNTSVQPLQIFPNGNTQPGAPAP